MIYKLIDVITERLIVSTTSMEDAKKFYKVCLSFCPDRPVKIILQPLG